MSDDLHVRAALRRLHRTHNILTRGEADGLARLLGVPASDIVED